MRRWAGRSRSGLDALEAVDDRTFRFRLNQPYSKDAVRSGQEQHALPVHHAGTHRRDRSRIKQITEYVGSGPMRFKKDEWVPGARAVFERFDGYTPREEKADLAVGRQADPFRPDRVADRPRRRHRRGRAAERRGRLAGDAARPT